MLAEASKPVLEELAATLATGVHLHPDIASAVCGNVVLHGAVLVGRNARGELGYVYMESRVRGGRIDTQIHEHFGASREITITSATDSDFTRFLQDWRLFSDPPVSVVSSILDRLKKASSAIGGPTQILRLDSTGPRWISRLPVCRAPEPVRPARNGGPEKMELVDVIRPVACLEGISTIAAAVTMTSPTLVITGSGFTVNIDSTNQIKNSNPTTGDYTTVGPSVVTVAGGSGGAIQNFSAQLTPQIVECTYNYTGCPNPAQAFIEIAAGSATVSATQSSRSASLSATTSGPSVQMNGVQVLTARQTGWTTPTGTLFRGACIGGSTTIGVLSEIVAALITDLMTHGIIGA